MHRRISRLTLLVAAVVLLTGGLWTYRDVTAQTTTPTRIFQTEVRLWAGDAQTDSWQFTYLADGSLHLVSTQEDGNCASLAVPEGVFVSFIGQDGAITSQPGTGEAITVCEAFLTRANG